MTADSNRRHRTRAGARRRARKDRLIQTRVAEDLESALKREAAKRRLTVSHLIRNTLEDTFNLVEDVTTDVEQLVSGSVELAAAVGRDARRLASLVRGRGMPAAPNPPTQAASPGDTAAAPDPPTQAASPGDTAAAPDPPAQAASPGDTAAAPDPLGHIYGWNRVVANRTAECALCSREIVRGDDALVGLSDDASKPRSWLCSECGNGL